MGAKISGIGTDVLVIEGVEKLGVETCTMTFFLTGSKQAPI